MFIPAWALIWIAVIGFALLYNASIAQQHSDESTRDSEDEYDEWTIKDEYAADAEWW